MAKNAAPRPGPCSDSNCRISHEKISASLFMAPTPTDIIYENFLLATFSINTCESFKEKVIPSITARVK